MKVIRAPSLGRAHELVVRYILQEGSFLRTENGEDTVETDEVCLRVETPMSSACSRFKEAFLDSYAHNLLFGSDAVFEYDYHGRLFDWGCGLCDASGEVHCDQVRYIVEKLRASPESRRAVGVTWCPPVDGKLGDCPCLQLIQCVVRDGRLDMKVVFRSNDMLSAAICCLRRGRICLLLHGCRSLWQRRSGRLWGRIRIFLWCRIFILSGMRRIFLRFVRKGGRLRRARLCAGRAVGAGFPAGNFFMF